MFNKLIIPIALILIFCFLSTNYFPWNDAINNAFLNFLYTIRGDRELSENILLVFISAEDIKALGGWPLSRDYYGYFTHIVSSKEAQVIGFDLLFHQPDTRHPEYDRRLANFFEAAGNICLPMAFSELTAEKKLNDRYPVDLFTGEEPTYPINEIRNHIKGMGFSNLGKDAVINRVPLLISHADSLIPSFGLELARLYLNCSISDVTTFSIKMNNPDGKSISVPIDHRGRFLLNHFGDIENVQTIGFLELLKTYETNPDSIQLKNKLVLIAVTAPGISPVKATPLSSTMPAVLIHATVAENILQQNYLTGLAFYVQWLIIILLIGVPWFFHQRMTRRSFTIMNAVILVCYWLTAGILFSFANVLLPIFYPTIALIAVFIIITIKSNREQQIADQSIHQLLAEQIAFKEKQLADAKIKLQELQARLEQESEISEQSLQLAEERKNAILKLEKEIGDIQSYIIHENQMKQPQFREIICAENSSMVHVLNLVSKVATDDIPVLITGETGTGKEMIARAIHQTSRRKNAPFVAINCGALTETLLDSELFGHEKGSFTGAQTRRKGRFELATGGTIFLDEITETTNAFQARLLRVLQEGAFERVGGEHTIRVDVRVIAATNKDLLLEMETNRFRADLFYRLNGFPIAVPPLRERMIDIPLLAVFFLRKHGYHTIESFSDRAMEKLQSFHWPGNVRELENVVRRAAIMAQSDGRSIIQENDLPLEVANSELLDVYNPLESQILDMLRSLKFSRSAISQTAKALGNRDRGTITEYFRGMCFEQLAVSEFNIDTAAKSIAGAADADVIERVKTKISEYLNNISPEKISIEEASASSKGLPKKYNPYFLQVIEHLHRS